MWAIFGMLPKGFLFGSLLVLVTLGGSLIQRQCRVMEQSGEIKDLKKKIEQANEDAGNWQKKHGECSTQNASLEFANMEFAKRAAAQNMLLDAMKHEADDRIAAAKKAGEAAKQAAAYQRDTVEWLASMLKRNTAKPGECPEAEAARIVRDGLKR